jgi:hypothetical protein
VARPAGKAGSWLSIARNASGGVSPRGCQAPRSTALNTRTSRGRPATAFTKAGVTSIVQTPDGYLWQVTEFRLARFDGGRPVRWRRPPTRSQTSKLPKQTRTVRKIEFALEPASLPTLSRSRRPRDITHGLLRWPRTCDEDIHESLVALLLVGAGRHVGADQSLEQIDWVEVLPHVSTPDSALDELHRFRGGFRQSLAVVQLVSHLQ